MATTATLLLTVPDTVMPRIQRAFGHPDPLNLGQWIDATPQEVIDQLKTQMKSRVIDYEIGVDAIASRVTKSGEIW